MKPVSVGVFTPIKHRLTTLMIVALLLPLLFTTSVYASVSISLTFIEDPTDPSNTYFTYKPSATGDAKGSNVLDMDFNYPQPFRSLKLWSKAYGDTGWAGRWDAHAYGKQKVTVVYTSGTAPTSLSVSGRLTWEKNSYSDEDAAWPADSWAGCGVSFDGQYADLQTGWQDDTKTLTLQPGNRMQLIWSVGAFSVGELMFAGSFAYGTATYDLSVF